MRNPKKGALVALFLMVSLFYISFASAELIFGQTESLYNVGDRFEVILTISPQTYTSNFLTSSLICGDRKIEFYKSPHSVAAGEQEEVIISTNLDKFLVEGVEGECYISATYESDSAESQRFDVTRGISLTLNVEGILFDPGESVHVYGKATKANGVPVDGFVEFSAPKIGLNFVGPVKLGEFNFSLTIPSDAPSGSHPMNVRAYENDVFEMTINEGNTTGVVKIRQIIKEVSIALSDQAVLPIEELTYRIVLDDQAGQEANADVSIEILRPDETIAEERIIKSGETIKVNLVSSSQPGYWQIKARLNDIETTKEFLVEEFKDVSFTLENQTLAVKNTGNIPYNGPVDIAIGKVNDVKELQDLAVGDSKKFKLLAPDGEYDIKVSKGSERQEVGRTYLTGNAISIEDLTSGGVFGTSFMVLIGLILILVIALVAVYFYRKFSKNKLAKLNDSDAAKTPVAARKVDRAGGVASDVKSINQLPTTVIDKGEKQESAIISLKIKNTPDLIKNQEATKIIDSALWKAKEAGAKIYSDGDFRIMIFAPVLTKEKDNTLRAIRIARGIERILHSFNRRTPTKIGFGIGVNAGSLVVESAQGKFRFMSLNNIISNTKRISNNSTENTLISEVFRRKMAGRIKAEKLKDKNLWKVEKVIDRSDHSEYVSKLAKKSADTSKRGARQN